MDWKVLWEKFNLSSHCFILPMTCSSFWFWKPSILDNCWHFSGLPHFPQRLTTTSFIHFGSIWTFKKKVFIFLYCNIIFSHNILCIFFFLFCENEIENVVCRMRTMLFEVLKLRSRLQGYPYTLLIIPFLPSSPLPPPHRHHLMSRPA